MRTPQTRRPRFAPPEPLPGPAELARRCAEVRCDTLTSCQPDATVVGTLLRQLCDDSSTIVLFNDGDLYQITRCRDGAKPHTVASPYLESALAAALGVEPPRRCSRCGRVFPLSSFRQQARSHVCVECHRREGKSRYASRSSALDMEAA